MEFILVIECMFCSIVLMRKISTTITGRNVRHISLENNWPQVVQVGK